MNFYKSSITLNQQSINDLKTIIENSETGCTFFKSEYLNTQESLNNSYFKDFIGGMNNDSPIAFILFKLNLDDSSLDKFFNSNDYLLKFIEELSLNLFIFNTKVNIEKKDIPLDSGNLSKIYFYENQNIEENRNIDISIFHEDINNQCRILMSLPRYTVYDNSNWNTIVNYDYNVLYKIIINRIKGVICSDSLII